MRSGFHARQTRCAVAAVVLIQSAVRLASQFGISSVLSGTLDFRLWVALLKSRRANIHVWLMLQ